MAFVRTVACMVTVFLSGIGPFLLISVRASGRIRDGSNPDPVS
jgi:hypothetical protein